MKYLCTALFTMLLTGCEAMEIISEVVEINENNRQHKCNMDITQCKKYGLEQVK